jgi:hemerythrin-like metal-binding protein
MDWSEEFGLGVAAMDEQHRALVDAMNEIYERAMAGATPTEMLSLIDGLISSARQHFSDEEAFMASIGFAELEKHRQVHHNLLDRLEQYRISLFETGRIGQDLFDFLRFWLNAHMCGIDRRYAIAAGLYNPARGMGTSA